MAVKGCHNAFVMDVDDGTAAEAFPRERYSVLISVGCGGDGFGCRCLVVDWVPVAGHGER